MHPDLKETKEKESLDVLLLGPAPVPIAKLKRNYRFHLQLRAPQLEQIHQLWARHRKPLPKNEHRRIRHRCRTNQHAVRSIRNY
ncbi:MAG: hypothetical protein R3C11_16765 [Planctomycetaceae bacterium]